MSARRAAVRAAPVLVAAAALAWGGSPAAAQWSPGGAASAGMGGAGLVFASGHRAVEWNPANLGFSRGWSVSLVDVGGAGLLRGTTLSDLVDIVSSDDEGGRALIERLPDDGLRVATVSEGFALTRGVEAADLPTAGASLPSFALQVGPVGLQVRSLVMGEATVSKELADLAVDGFNPERIQEYAVRQTGFRATSFSEVTLAWGHRVENLSVGVGLRWVQGNRLAQGRLFEPVVDLDEETLAVTGVAVESPGGSGWGVDVGLAINLGGGVRWSLAARNALQRMTWDEDLRVHEAVLTDETLEDEALDEIMDRFGDEALDPTAIGLETYQTAADLFEGAYFPMIARTGLGWARGGTLVEVTAAAVSPRGRQHADWEQRVSLGVEQQVGFLVLRAGAARASDGIRAVTGGLGFRMGPVRLDLGVGRMSGSLDAERSWDGLQGGLSLAVFGGGA